MHGANMKIRAMSSNIAHFARLQETASQCALTLCHAVFPVLRLPALLSPALLCPALRLNVRPALQTDCAVKCKVSCLMFTTQQAAGMLSNKLALCESPSGWLGSSCLDPPCDMFSFYHDCVVRLHQTHFQLYVKVLRILVPFLVSNISRERRTGSAFFNLPDMKSQNSGDSFPQKLSQRTDPFDAFRGHVSNLEYLRIRYVGGTFGNDLDSPHLQKLYYL